MYSGRVLVGFWFDKLQLESEQRARQAERRDRGELAYQQRFRLLRAFNRSVALPVPADPGFVHYGQPVLLQAPEVRDLSRHFTKRTGCPDQEEEKEEPGQEPRDFGLLLAATASPLDLDAGVHGIRDGCGLGCTAERQPAVRSVFAFLPARPGLGPRLQLGRECFLQLVHATEELYLRSEPPRIDGQFGPNYHNPVRLSRAKDCYAKWRPVHWDRHRRFETEAEPVSPCTRIVIQHVMTNQCLAVEQLNWHRSLLGFECGVSVYTYSDMHRNETSECIWNVIAEAGDDDRAVDLAKCQ